MVNINNELEITLKEAVVTQENHKNLGHNILSPGRDLNLGPSDYE
jgi:hypothetical protein